MKRDLRLKSVQLQFPNRGAASGSVSKTSVVSLHPRVCLQGIVSAEGVEGGYESYRLNKTACHDTKVVNVKNAPQVKEPPPS